MPYKSIPPKLVRTGSLLPLPSTTAEEGLMASGKFLYCLLLECYSHRNFKVKK